jgi:hypothetical protein
MPSPRAATSRILGASARSSSFSRQARSCEADEVGSANRPNAAFSVGNWLRHAVELSKLALPWSIVAELVDTLETLPKLEEVILVSVTGDLSVLSRLQRMTVLRLQGTLQLRGLAGHPSLEWLDLAGEARDFDALARIPKLRGFQ